MTAQLINGKLIAEQIHSETAEKAARLKSRGIEPCIVFIRVGEDPASQAYVGMKDKKAHSLGIKSKTHVFPENHSEPELLAFIEKLNSDRSVHGILVQAPLPPQISQTRVFSTVSPDKDVDGFHPVNMGKLLLGDSTGFRPCTPAGVQELLIRSNLSPAGKKVVILGRGNIVGKPLAAILCQKDKWANATVTLAHSATRDIGEITRQADIVVAAMGVAGFLRGDMVKPGAIVIDVGVNRVADPASAKGYKLTGDIAFNEICEVASHVTPNPGGVGPMTIALLMANTVLAAERQNG